jgi:hypothetical protein
MSAEEIYQEILELPEDLQIKVEVYIKELKSNLENNTKRKIRTAGGAQGWLSIPDDFDDPIPDFEGY